MQLQCVLSVFPAKQNTYLKMIRHFQIYRIKYNIYYIFEIAQDIFTDQNSKRNSHFDSLIFCEFFFLNQPYSDNLAEMGKY